VTSRLSGTAVAGVAAVGAALFTLARRAARAISFDGKSVLIVGGSRGLGLVIARQLALEGARVTLAARDLDELERAARDLESRGASQVTTVVCDIRDRTQVERMVGEVAAARAGLDVLINDAGIIQVGPAAHMTIEDFENAMSTHFWGPLYTTLAALPHLKQSATPRIVNISSIGGKIAVPHLLPYSASKFALVGLSAGLHHELAREGIRVTTVCPGLMRTGSTYNARFKGKHRLEFAWFHLADAVPGLSVDAGSAARQIIESCRRGDAELVISLPARLAVVAQALCPNTMAALMSVTNRLLPKAAGADGNEDRSGWQSVSRAAPSVLSRSSDRATLENNEVPVRG
jgi:NAD(P)-dependent dehydrogenase (short-subunit alcohol dehydrogenase family)